ncbi:hypothetical protein Dimus_035588 [Dionaea muscipula]
MGRKSRKKSRKILGEWICPGIVQGLSVEYKYPSSEEDNCSLHTIDEEDHEDSPDSSSNPSEGDLSEDEQQFHESQPMADLEIVKSGDSCQPPLPVMEVHPQHAPYEQPNMECHPELLLQMDSPSSPPSQRQIEEGQSSSMNRDCSRPSATVTNLNNVTRAPTSKVGRLELRSIASKWMDCLRFSDEMRLRRYCGEDHMWDVGQPASTPTDDQLGLLQVTTHDIPMANIASCSESDEQHALENDSQSLTRKCTTTRTSVPVSNEADGFIPVQKKGLNTDTSDSGSDMAALESSLPMEPIEEESEAISGDDSYSSSKGDAESLDDAIDDAIPEGEDVHAEIASESGIPPVIDNLGFQATQISLQTDRDADRVNLQVNPRSSNSSFDFADNPCPSDSDTADLCPIPVDLGKIPCSRDPPPLSSCPVEKDHTNGLSTDASEASCENADLEASNPMEPIEEESEIISEDESCSSSNGDFATSELASDEVASQGNDGRIEPSTFLGILPHSDILGFPEVQFDPQSEHPANQMNLQANPNSSIPSKDVCEASNLCILGGETDNQVISNSQLHSKPDDLHEVTCSRDSEPSSSIPADANHVHESSEQNLDVQCEASEQIITDFAARQCEASKQVINATNTGILTDSARQPSMHTGLEAQHDDPSCSTLKDMGVLSSDEDGFKKVQKRRRRKSNELNPNPEHHQDKPGAKATS